MSYLSVAFTIIALRMKFTKRDTNAASGGEEDSDNDTYSVIEHRKNKRGNREQLGQFTR